jgi:hypothetical protein
MIIKAKGMLVPLLHCSATVGNDQFLGLDWVRYEEFHCFPSTLPSLFNLTIKEQSDFRVSAMFFIIQTKGQERSQHQQHFIFFTLQQLLTQFKSPLFERRKDDKVGRKNERKVFQMGLLKNPAPLPHKFFSA